MGPAWPRSSFGCRRPSWTLKATDGALFGAEARRHSASALIRAEGALILASE